MVQKFLLVLFILASVGVPAFYFLRPPDFGVSPIAPLGEFEQIEKWFVGLDYVKTMKVVDDEFVEKHGAAYRGSRIFKFSFKKQRAEGYPRIATVVVAPDGRVRRIGALFNTGRSYNHPPDLAPHKFVLFMWKLIAGREPEFHDVREGFGTHMQMFLVDSLNTNGVRGEWKKLYRDRGRDRTIYDQVQFWMDDDEDDG